MRLETSPSSDLSPAAKPAGKKPTRPGILSPREVAIRTVVYGVLGAGLLYIFLQVYGMLLVDRRLTAAHFRVDFRPLLNAWWLIQLHVAAAVSTFGIGVAIMLQRKGSRFHRQLGWTWSATMGFTALSSFFIQGEGHLSWIHGLSAFTVILLPMALVAARAHKAKIHSRLMMTLFLGGMVAAGTFTFLPGRLMWRLFFGVDV
ncbi:MAG: hypothetical protein ABI740_06280 [Alphaproteobacteria bacterium]